MNKKLGSVASSHRTPPTETVLQYRFAALLSQYLLQKTHYHRAAFQANIIPHFRVSHVVGGSFSKRRTACRPMLAGFNTFFGVGSHAFQNSFRCLQVSSGAFRCLQVSFRCLQVPRIYGVRGFQVSAHRLNFYVI